ncbi:vacuolar ATP synthase subunit E-like protein [Hamiltosporidium tvaerminnensis]|uniref:Vacuolar ATP synthase subunit E-like protein n=2 Tax=Hamiltosporidium TaxID=1176354 RepID=A0A4Q9M0W0_9MICR|nr:vacuolar ATP synthase subunit E-like protein [Hamiltosporidium magnivora]TBU13357.1 vacuolar ATP synthase subunit E-like protein [Hamiltosporidium tvaerminnensis]TBU13655.1 vacuolar ATP synthase subunit E-like protein [Hamiltosporidium tvaerminnensis]
MEVSQEQDIERIVSFIKHEAKEKVQEILIKASEEYNTEKAKIVRSETMKIEKDYLQRKKKLEIQKVMNESVVRSELRMKELLKKVNLLEIFFMSVKKSLKNRILKAENILKDCEKIKENKILIFCLKKDEKYVKNCVGNKYEIEVKELGEEYIGGVIVCNSDRSVIIDNSFKSLIEILKEKYMSLIWKILVKGC